MEFSTMLKDGFEQFRVLIRHPALYSLGYSEYFCYSYLTYQSILEQQLLRPGMPLYQAFLSIGVSSTDSMSQLFLHSFYLYLHAHDQIKTAAS